MNRPSRKPTVRPPRNVSIRISLSMPRRLTRTDLFRLQWIFCIRNHYSSTSIPLRRNVSARISLRGQRRLIWVDTLRRSSRAAHIISDVRVFCCACLRGVLRRLQHVFSYITAFQG